ncbi:MAG: pseudouridine synthase [Planctomycetota bacterium]
MSSPQGAARPPLVRFLSRCHVASRPEARRLVQAGRVTVNGRRVTDGAWRVDPQRDRVEVDGKEIRLDEARAAHVWWVVNKPRGTVATTRDPEGRPTVLELVPEPRAPGLAPVGRLDKASAGLLLLTNDHGTASRLLDPRSHVAKVYRVKVRGHPSEATLHAWRTEAVVDDGLPLGPMDVTVERAGPKSCWLSVTLREGKNRQIRRRVEAAGHAVEVLVRMRFGPLELGTLAPGAARQLTTEEHAALVACVDPDTASNAHP